MLLIGIVSAKGIRKKCPYLTSRRAPALVCPTPPVIRVVLLHTETLDKDLCPDTLPK